MPHRADFVTYGLIFYDTFPAQEVQIDGTQQRFAASFAMVGFQFKERL